MRVIIIFIVASFYCLQGFSQANGFKNTIFVNLTNPAIFGDKAFVVGYERTIGKNQSFTFHIGRMSLPRLLGGSGSDSVKVQKNSNEKGFHIGGDYRFYLKKENRYEAPRGVYIGPYYSYNYFSRDNEWLFQTAGFSGNAGTQTSLGIHTAGIELGYQFVLWKRVALDFVMLGPGLGIYNVKAAINTNMNAEDEALLFGKINDFLQDKIPGFNHVIKEGEFKKTGTSKTTTFGYRFMINVGFRF